MRLLHSRLKWRPSRANCLSTGLNGAFYRLETTDNASDFPLKPDKAA